MNDYLILKLQGVMQSWGEHTFEGLRPSTNFPTRSALLGLLAACIGIDRDDREKQQTLADSVLFAVRQDSKMAVKMMDYHTVQDARVEYTGLKSHRSIVTQREYLLDAAFTLVIWSNEDAVFSLDNLQEAVCCPRFTPFLGRRSCPISRPLFESRLESKDVREALKQVEPGVGVIYSEEDPSLDINRKCTRHRVRDVPLVNQPRQFATRMVFVFEEEETGASK